MPLTPRWEPLRPHDGQSAYFNSPHRFNVVPAGRRSGKTECAKRKLITRAIAGSRYIRPRYFAAAPTRDQAKRIYWDDLLAMIPRDLLGEVRIADLSIKLETGIEIVVVGMDKPERIEGSPWDGGVLDEYANMKATAWEANILPALADRNGWCDLIGVPEGRNHYYDIFNRAKADMEALGAASAWGAYTWHTDTVLNATPQGRAFLDEARRTMSDRFWRQEFQASFESFTGVVLYAFTRENVVPCKYDPAQPLHIGLDFNVNPMTATVWQERAGKSYQVGEVIIPTSNTDEMADEITRRYGRMSGGRTTVNHITVYPDPAGAQRRTSAQGKTDISILRERGFQVMALSSHPLVRDRLNVTNARFCNAAGERLAFVDPGCRKSVESYERLVYREGTSDPDKTMGFDHVCLAAGTLVDTPDGHIPINELPSTGLVRTWDGSFVPYEGAGLTRQSAPLVELWFADGASVRCTPDHMLLTTNGWIKACDSLGLTVCIQLGYVRGDNGWTCGSSARQPNRLMAQSTICAGSTSRPRGVGSIGRSGNIITARFLRECTSIIRTRIGQTTISATSTYCPDRSIYRFTQAPRIVWRHLGLGCRSLRKQPANGTLRKRVGLGIASITQIMERLCTARLTRFVSSVAGSLQGPTTAPPLCIAQTGARLRPAIIAESITSSGSAQSVARHLLQTDTAALDVVQSRADRGFGGNSVVRVSHVEKHEPVYCLTVPSDGCFALANGIIVKNCDGAGYYFFSRFGQPGLRLQKVGF